jgi:hypothetical protein
MRPWFAVVIGAAGLLLSGVASAHRIDEYLQATIVTVQRNRIEASMRLIPGVVVAPTVIAAIDANNDGILSTQEAQSYARHVLGDLSISVDGKKLLPKLISWSFPSPSQMRDGMGEIRITYTVELGEGHPNRVLLLANRHLSAVSVYLMNVVVPEDPDIQILAQKRNQQQSWYEVDYHQEAAVASSPTPGARIQTSLNGLQFASFFRLGVRHIAEGTDHLLFLLAMLLPAPLLACGSRWGRSAGLRQSLLRILGIVTAFTIGHSITLSLAALSIIRVPERPIEVPIAASILVSALHAMRPLFPGKETLIAGCFGLIHGLAFAATLDRLGLEIWQKLVGIFAFNLGIESMQMLVVAVVLPSLLLLSASRAYPAIRLTCAAFAAAASVGWLLERLLGVSTPVDLIVNTIARYGPWMAGGALLVSVSYKVLLAARQVPQVAGRLVNRPSAPRVIGL